MLSTEWLSAFVPVGVLQNGKNWIAAGAGILFTHHSVLWVVTAGHLVDAVGEDNLSLLFTQEEGKPAVVELSQPQKASGLGWLRNQDADLAIGMVPVLPEQLRFKALCEANCLSLDEVMPTMQCYTIGCPYSLHGMNPDAITPLALDGIIAGKTPDKRLVYTSAPTFPGNSGGPLIAVRSPFHPTGRVVAGRPTIFWVGIMLQSVLFPDPNRSQPPLSLGVATSTDAVLELLRSEAAAEQVLRVLPKQTPIGA
jgi:hypothetical protein